MGFTARAASNSFHVNDTQALRDALAGLEITVAPAEDGSDPNHVCLLSSQRDGAWPTARYDTTTDEFVEIEIAELIAPHLKPGEVAVLKQTGSQRATRIGAYAVAVNDQGKTVELHIDEIFERAKGVLGGNVAETI